MMHAAPPDPEATDGAVDTERLFDLQLSFNLYPAGYAHPSWLVRLGPRVTHEARTQELQASPLWIRAVSSALLRSEHLDQHFDCDFFDPAKRLALLDAPTLARVAGLVSATLLRDRLQRAVRQTDVHELQACIGAEAHAFAVRWPGLLPMVRPPVEAGAWPSRGAWERMCVSQLVAALPSHAIAVIGRLRMRFPRDWSLPGRQRLTEPQRVGLTRLIVAIVHEAVPLWRWLFAENAATGEARC